MHVILPCHPVGQWLSFSCCSSASANGCLKHVCRRPSHAEPVTDLRDNILPLQVHPQGIRLLVGKRVQQEIFMDDLVMPDADPTAIHIKHACIQDPYLLVHLSDLTVGLFKASSPGGSLLLQPACIQDSFLLVHVSDLTIWPLLSFLTWCVFVSHADLRCSPNC